MKFVKARVFSAAWFYEEEEKKGTIDLCRNLLKYIANDVENHNLH